MPSLGCCPIFPILVGYGVSISFCLISTTIFSSKPIFKTVCVVPAMRIDRLVCGDGFSSQSLTGLCCFLLLPIKHFHPFFPFPAVAVFICWLFKVSYFFMLSLDRTYNNEFLTQTLRTPVTSWNTNQGYAFREKNLCYFWVLQLEKITLP